MTKSLDPKANSVRKMIGQGHGGLSNPGFKKKVFFGDDYCKSLLALRYFLVFIFFTLFN